MRVSRYRYSFSARVLLVAALVALAGCSKSADVDAELILGNVSVVNVVTGTVDRIRDVVIEDGRISAIVPSHGSQWLDHARRIDLTGMYLTPQLYDLHVHIFDKRDLQLYALKGVQAVRNLDGWDWHLGLREQSAGPWSARLFTSGRQYQSPLVQSPDQLRAGFAEDEKVGYDWIKLYDELDQELFDAVVAAPHGSMRITGHLPDDLPLSDVLEAAIYDDIAHAEELYYAMRAQNPEWTALVDDVAARMIATDTALTTTLVTNKMIIEQMSDFESNISRDEVAFAPPLVQMFWASDFNPYKSMKHGSVERMSQNFEDMKKMVAEMSARGVVILAGTDAPNPTSVPAFSLYEELELLVEAGLSPAEAIRTATSDAAAHLGQGQVAGQIVDGAMANFIVTHENPLENISALRSFTGLVSHGDHRMRGQIDAELAELRAEYASDLEYLRFFSPSGPEAIFDAMKESVDPNPISEAGLQSLVWIYVKFGNPEAAALVAEALQTSYPSAENEAIRRYLGNI